MIRLAQRPGPRFLRALLAAFLALPAALPADADEGSVPGRPVDQGLWRIRRAADSPLALALSGPGDTIASLARKAGLDPSEWRLWLTPLGEPVRLLDDRGLPFAALGSEIPLAEGQAFGIPNVIAALWLGDLGRLGQALTDWRGDLAYLRRRGFQVKDFYPHGEADHACGVTDPDLPEPCADCPSVFWLAVYKSLRAAREARALHGLLITSHRAGYPDGKPGVCTADGKITFSHAHLGHRDYGLGFVLINACYSEKLAADLASPYGRVHGASGLLIPPFETVHPRELLRPGEQGTVVHPPPSRSRRRS